MSKELEAFHRICVIAFGDDESFDDIHDVKEVETALKALEIIKESGILVVDDYPEMLRGIGGIDLTKEEYDLLKEVLDND